MRLDILLAILPLVLAAPNVFKRATPAPLLAKRANAQVIAGKYIVKMKEGSSLAVASGSVMSLLALPADSVYENIFSGFAGAMNPEVLDMVRNHPDVRFLTPKATPLLIVIIIQVEYVEPDSKVYASEFVTQNGAPWGLGRISHKAKGSTDYTYDSTGGEGACVYIIDTGVEDTHPVSIYSQVSLPYCL